MSFTLPLRSGDFLTCRLPLFFIILVSGFIGGLVIMALRQGEYRFLSKRGCYYAPSSDTVIELRQFAQKLAAKIKGTEE